MYLTLWPDACLANDDSANDGRKRAGREGGREGGRLEGGKAGGREGERTEGRKEGRKGKRKEGTNAYWLCCSQETTSCITKLMMNEHAGHDECTYDCTADTL